MTAKAEYWREWPESERYKDDAVNRVIYGGGFSDGDFEHFMDDREALEELVGALLSQADYTSDTIKIVKSIMAND
jgi:hypothetical protein